MPRAIKKVLTIKIKFGTFRRMTRKEFIDKFFDLCKDAQEEIPPNVIALNHRDYAEAWIR